MTTKPIRITDGVELDVLELANSRAMIQAGSGGGKSYLARLIIEQAAETMPVIVIDPEGEYYTAREVCSMVLVGAGGELPATVESAAAVARGLLEQSCSAIIDLSELPAPQHKPYIAAFFSAVMNSPRQIWRPTLFAIDEAYRFCSEGMHDAAATAIADLMSRGRKRGYGGLLITQRLSKVGKDAAAEAGTQFFGRTLLDLDLKRAADMLGISKSEAGVLRTLKKGEWLAFGPALSGEGVLRFRADRPQTKPPKAGQAVPPVKDAAVLARIAETVTASQTDQPLTLEDALERIEQLRAELSQAGGGISEQDAHQRAEQARHLGIEQGRREIAARFRNVAEQVTRAAHNAIDATLAEALRDGEAVGAEPHPSDRPERVVAHDERRNTIAAKSPKPPRGRRSADQRFLDALRWWESAGVEEPTQTQIAVIAGISPTSSTLRGARSTLRDLGMVEYDGDRTRLTGKGRAAAADPGLSTIDDWHAAIRRQLGTGAPLRVFDTLISTRHPISQDRLAAETEISPTSSTIRGAVGALRKLGLVADGQPIQLTELAWPKALTRGTTG